MKHFVRLVMRICGRSAVCALLLGAAALPRLAHAQGRGEPPRLATPHFRIAVPSSLEGAPVVDLAVRALEDAYGAMISAHFRVPPAPVEIELPPDLRPGTGEMEVRLACTRALFTLSLDRVSFPGEEISGPVARGSSAWFLDSLTLYACSSLLRRPDLVDDAVRAAPRFLQDSLDRASPPDSAALAAFWRFLEGRHPGIAARVLQGAAGRLGEARRVLEEELRARKTVLAAEYALFAREYAARLRDLARRRIRLAAGAVRREVISLEMGRLSSVVIPVEAAADGSSVIVRAAFDRSALGGPSVELLGGWPSGALTPERPVLRIPGRTDGAFLLVCNASPTLDPAAVKVEAYLLSPPSIPSVVTSTRERLLLGWQASDPDADTLFRYRVYRKISGEGELRLVAVTAEGVNIWEERDYRPDRGVSYAVRAVDSLGNESADSPRLVLSGTIPVFKGRLEVLVPASLPEGWRRGAPEALRFGGGSRVRGLRIASRRTMLHQGKALTGEIEILLEQYPSAEEARGAYEEGLRLAGERYDRYANLKRTAAPLPFGDAGVVLRYERDDLGSPLLKADLERWYVHYERVLLGEVVATAAYEGPAAVGEYRDWLDGALRAIVEKARRGD